MIKIEIPEFAIIKDNELIDNGSINNNLQFSINKQEGIIIVKFDSLFYEKEEVFLKISILCYFEIEPKAWEKIVNNNSVPKTLLKHITFHTVGALRGILFSKLEKTFYSSLILPPINVEEMIEDDLKLDN